MTEKEIPEALLEKMRESEAREIAHNWLYSFLPVGKANYPALVGFCKQCRHTFAYVMPLPAETWISAKTIGYKEFDSFVPKYGCVPTVDI
jgi:hypothetical protein